MGGGGVNLYDFALRVELGPNVKHVTSPTFQGQLINKKNDIYYGFGKGTIQILKNSLEWCKKYILKLFVGNHSWLNLSNVYILNIYLSPVWYRIYSSESLEELTQRTRSWSQYLE